jgi:hypothetical protein
LYGGAARRGNKLITKLGAVGWWGRVLNDSLVAVSLLGQNQNCISLHCKAEEVVRDGGWGGGGAARADIKLHIPSHFAEELALSVLEDGDDYDIEAGVRGVDVKEARLGIYLADAARAEGLLRRIARCINDGLVGWWSHGIAGADGRRT